MVYLSTSRGCPYRCAYCVECNFWKGVRYRSPDKIVEDINEFQKSIRTNELFFSDSTFNCNQKRLKTLAKLLKHFDLYYYANVRPDMLTNNIRNILKSCHFIGLFVGLQSVSKVVLTKVNRSLQVWSDFNIMLNKVEEFPFSSFSFIFGLPGETLETANETISAFSQFYDKGIFSITSTVLVPYPGTPIFEEPRRYGVNILTKNYSRYSRYDFPVYSLDSLNRSQIWSVYLKSLRKITELNCSRVGGVLSFYKRR